MLDGSQSMDAKYQIIYIFIYLCGVAYQTSDEVCIRQSPCNIIALRHGVFKPIGGRNKGVVGIEKGKAQACKTKDSDTNKLASSDASGGRDGVVVSGGHGGVGLHIHADIIAAAAPPLALHSDLLDV